MKYLIMLLILHSTVSAKNSIFAPLLKSITHNNLEDWETNKMNHAKIFYQIQTNNSRGFQEKLLKFIQNDIERHYNIAMFVGDKYYLAKRKANLALSLLIFTKGIWLIDKSNDKFDKYEEVAFRVFAAIAASKLNKEELARHHKRRAKFLIKKGAQYSGHFPAISEEDKKIYKSIEI